MACIPFIILGTWHLMSISWMGFELKESDSLFIGVGWSSLGSEFMNLLICYIIDLLHYCYITNCDWIMIGCYITNLLICYISSSILPVVLNSGKLHFILISYILKKKRIWGIQSKKMSLLYKLCWFCWILEACYVSVFCTDILRFYTFSFSSPGLAPFQMQSHHFLTLACHLAE